MSDVPRSLQSWGSTIQSVVLTADIFQLFIKYNIIDVYRYIYSRSPRRTINSGSPRMLLVLVREFESRRGEILNLYAKIKKDQLLRAPSVGKHNSTRVDEGRKSWNLLAIKMQGTNRSGEGEEELAMWPRIWVTTINRREREKEGRR